MGVEFRRELVELQKSFELTSKFLRINVVSCYEGKLTNKVWRLNVAVSPWSIWLARNEI